MRIARYRSWLLIRVITTTTQRSIWGLICPIYEREVFYNSMVKGLNGLDYLNGDIVRATGAIGRFSTLNINSRPCSSLYGLLRFFNLRLSTVDRALTRRAMTAIGVDLRVTSFFYAPEANATNATMNAITINLCLIVFRSRLLNRRVASI